MSTRPDPASRRGRNRLRPLVWGGATLLLMLPAVAMRFTAEVDWDVRDFLVMGVMLGVACGLYEFAAWLSGSPVYRLAFGIAVVTGFLTVWVNLAVGMLGSEGNPINLMFGGVLLVAATGSLLARFRADGMARAMGVTAGTQVLAAAIGLALGVSGDAGGSPGPVSYREAFLTACFALPWLVSSMLFRRAAYDRARAGRAS